MDEFCCQGATFQATIMVRTPLFGEVKNRAHTRYTLCAEILGFFYPHVGHPMRMVTIIFLGK